MSHHIDRLPTKGGTRAEYEKSGASGSKVRPCCSVCKTEVDLVDLGLVGQTEALEGRWVCPGCRQ